MSRIAGLMAVEAASLAVMSVLHFGDRLDGSKPFEPTRAVLPLLLLTLVILLSRPITLRAP